MTAQEPRLTSDQHDELAVAFRSAAWIDTDSEPEGEWAAYESDALAAMDPVIDRWLTDVQREGRQEVAAKVEALVRLISPDHITPMGARQGNEKDQPEAVAGLRKVLGKTRDGDDDE